jgi:hypothetical protein
VETNTVEVMDRQSLSLGHRCRNDRAGRHPVWGQQDRDRRSRGAGSAAVRVPAVLRARREKTRPPNDAANLRRHGTLLVDYRNTFEHVTRRGKLGCNLGLRSPRVSLLR